MTIMDSFDRFSYVLCTFKSFFIQSEKIKMITRAYYIVISQRNLCNIAIIINNTITVNITLYILPMSNCDTCSLCCNSKVFSVWNLKPFKYFWSTERYSGHNAFIQWFVFETLCHLVWQYDSKHVYCLS